MGVRRDSSFLGFRVQEIGFKRKSRKTKSESRNDRN